MAIKKICPVCGEEMNDDHRSCIENEELIARLWTDQPILKALMKLTKAFDPLNIG